MRKKYDTYKDSGIDWIGKIPSHWDISKLKYETNCLDGRRVPVEKSLRNVGIYPYWGAGSIVGYIDEYIFDEELVLLGEDGAPFFDKNRPVAFYVNEKIWANNHIHVLKSGKNMIAKYMTYLLNIVDYHQFINGSILTKLTQASMDEIPFIVPSLAEQEAIAAYLDDKCGKVDALVSALEQQMSDLADLKKSEISRVVTKGLNPNAPLKDSGIDWIGMIPEDWVALPLKRLVDEPLMYGANESAESNNPNFPRYIRITDIAEDGSLKADTFKSLPPEKANNYMLSKGDVLFARSGATVGKTFVYDSNRPACFAGYLIKAKCNQNRLSPKFLIYYTRSNEYMNWKNSVFAQATIQNIGADKYSICTLPVPPLDEQQAIVDYLDAYCAKIDATVSEIKAQIADLKLYKQSLISEAVTGKICVTD